MTIWQKLRHHFLVKHGTVEQHARLYAEGYRKMASHVIVRELVRIEEGGQQNDKFDMIVRTILRTELFDRGQSYADIDRKSSRSRTTE